MKLKRPYIARLDEVIITRENETAIIEYKEANVWLTHLTLGEKIYAMSDQDILGSHNNHIRSQIELMKNYKHVATEIPPGQPQVRFSSSGHWVPRGDVLRCDISCKDGETTILVDDKELTMQEFGDLLSVYEGWGMRIIMVPEDEICQSPAIEVKDPDSEKAGSTPISSHLISSTDH